MCKLGPNEYCHYYAQNGRYSNLETTKNKDPHVRTSQRIINARKSNFLAEVEEYSD